MKFCGFLFSILLQVYSQAQNLLANGGFEEENICTEYKINCAPEAWLVNDDVFFSYFKDANRAHNGVRCMAIEAGHAIKPYKRTFIRSQLLCGLRKGNEYVLGFFVKSRDPILDSIGVYFTYYDFLFGKSRLQNIKPSFYLADAKREFKKDSSWQKVEFVYKANGSETFITIGNFSKRDITGATRTKMENTFFVFVDDILLVPLNVNETLCDDWRITKEGIYQQDERHEFLRRKIKAGKLNPPDTVKPDMNRMVLIDTILLPNILFETAKADLQPGNYPLLDSLCQKIITARVDSIIVEGHTDSIGGYMVNEKLSMDRANSVKNYLQSKTGYSSITTRGWAFLKPIAGNQTSEGRKQNRRVEVFLYTRE